MPEYCAAAVAVAAGSCCHVFWQLLKSKWQILQQLWQYVAMHDEIRVLPSRYQKRGRAELTTATWLKLLMRKMVPSFLVLKVRGSCMSRSIQAYLMRSKLWSSCPSCTMPVQLHNLLLKKGRCLSGIRPGIRYYPSVYGIHIAHSSTSNWHSITTG